MNSTYSTPADLAFDTLGVLVLFETELGQSKSYLSLGQNLQALGAEMDLLVFDNSPTHQSIPSAGQRNPFRIHYEHHPENPGISKGYNKGYERAQQMRKNWLLLLDQDTTFPEFTFEKYFEAASSYQKEVLFVPTLTDGHTIYSPCRYRYKKASILTRLKTGVQPLEGKSVLNSGIFIRADAFNKAGKYNEQLRLDFSDFDFIDRLRIYHQNFVLVNLECSHQFFDNQLDLSKAVGRFKIYAEGSEIFATSLLSRLILGIQLVKRMLVLTMRFRSMQFIKVLFTK